MAHTMTVRLDDAHDRMLTEFARTHGRSKNEVVSLAIEELTVKEDKSVRTRAAFDRILKRDAQLLEALSQ